MRRVALVLSLSILAAPAAASAHGGDPSVVHACVHKDRRDGEVHGHVRIVLPNLDGDFTTLILPATIEGPGHTVYVPDTSATPRPVAAQSLLMQGACFSWLSNLQSAVPAIPLVDLDTLYAPPFTVR